MRIVEALRALLSPALCERCGQSWTPRRTAGTDGRVPSPPPCPVCGFGGR
ncbi:hypothetical protein ACFOD9_04600 [Novosphingobium bradum]|uniref:Uncharacterized protein n=1 Tax=Novosphingobium bradum TaxID=1737444 RepID=A0ABV7ILN6_9SPHN